MDLEALYEKAVGYKLQQEKILKELEYDFDKAEADEEYRNLEKLQKDLFVKIRELESARIIDNSFLFIK